MEMMMMENRKTTETDPRNNLSNPRGILFLFAANKTERKKRTFGESERENGGEK